MTALVILLHAAVLVSVIHATPSVPSTFLSNWNEQSESNHVSDLILFLFRYRPVLIMHTCMM